MRNFLIFDTDGEELTDLKVYLDSHFVVEKCLNWWKVTCHFGSHTEFCGLFKSRDDAQMQISRCENDFKDAQRGVTKADGFQFANTVPTEELIHFCEKNALAEKTAAVEQCLQKVESFLDKLRVQNLQDGGVLP